MCHGHPRYHPCGHSSLVWYYCPSALIDLETGYETPCRNVSFAPAQSSNLDCPLQNCFFGEKGGSWICCQCKQGPNNQGWCTTPAAGIETASIEYLVEEDQKTCDHGCCDQCAKFGKFKILGKANMMIMLTRHVMAGPSPSPSPERRFPDVRKGGSKKLGYGVSSRSQQRGSPFSLIGGSALEKAKEHGSTTASASSSGQGSAKYKIEVDYRSKKSKSSKKTHKSKSRA